LTAIIIYLIVASYSFNFYNLANKANLGRCTVSFTATNSNKTTEINMVTLAVKIKGGTTWSKEYHNWYIVAGRTKQFTIGLDFGCDSKRKYLFVLTRVSDGSPEEYDYYYPSKSSWTTETSIDLGDLNRFFTK
jgi:hypothetical protein